MEFLNDYVVVVIMAICWCIGYILKNIVPTDKIDKFIPLIMGCLGLFLNIWMNSWQITPYIILGGLASGLASTGANELVKQLIPGKEDNNNVK